MHLWICQESRLSWSTIIVTRQWNAKLTASFVEFGFVQSKDDYSLFTKTTSTSFTALLVYVNDIILLSLDASSNATMKQFWKSKFKIKDIGSLKYFIGIEVRRSNKGIQPCQCKYPLNIMVETCMLAFKPLLLPMEPNLKLRRDKGELFNDPVVYRKLVGKLLYLTNIKPDLNHSVHLSSQFIETPRIHHYNAILKVLRYIKGTPCQRLFFPVDSQLNLTAYLDTSWTDCPNTCDQLLGSVYS